MWRHEILISMFARTSNLSMRIMLKNYPGFVTQEKQQITQFDWCLDKYPFKRLAYM